VEVQSKRTRVEPGLGHRDRMLFVHHASFEAAAMPNLKTGRRNLDCAYATKRWERSWKA
jgi:hypothetical protein